MSICNIPGTAYIYYTQPHTPNTSPHTQRMWKCPYDIESTGTIGTLSRIPKPTQKLYEYIHEVYEEAVKGKVIRNLPEKQYRAIREFEY